MTNPNARQRAESSLSQLPPPDVELAAAWLARLASGDGAQGGPFGRALGVRFTRMGNGECGAEMDVGPELYNPGGVLHGSIAHALIDLTMGGAVFSLVGPGHRLATIEIKVSYLHAVKEGLLIAASRVVQNGKHIVFLESSVTTAPAEVVATGSGSYYVS